MQSDSPGFNNTWENYNTANCATSTDTTTILVVGNICTGQSQAPPTDPPEETHAVSSTVVATDEKPITFPCPTVSQSQASRSLPLNLENRWMLTVTLEEAQAHLPELIQLLQPGQALVITQDQKPVARLVVEPPPSR